MDELPKLAVQLLPVATLVLGWVLSQFAGWTSIRRQNKRELNLALAEMLEVYQAVRLLSVQYDLYSERYDLNLAQRRELRAWLKAELPRSESLQERLRTSIQSVASMYPVLGAAMRSSQVVQSHFFSNMEGDVADEALALDVEADEASAASITTKLRGYLLLLARKAGWVTWWQTRRYLKALEPSSELTAEQERFIERVDQLILPRLAATRPANSPLQADEGHKSSQPVRTPTRS